MYRVNENLRSIFIVRFYPQRNNKHRCFSTCWKLSGEFTAETPGLLLSDDITLSSLVFCCSLCLSQLDHENLCLVRYKEGERSHKAKRQVRNWHSNLDNADEHVCKTWSSASFDGNQSLVEWGDKGVRPRHLRCNLAQIKESSNEKSQIWSLPKLGGFGSTGGL